MRGLAAGEGEPSLEVLEHDLVLANGGEDGLVDGALGGLALGGHLVSGLQVKEREKRWTKNDGK